MRLILLSSLLFLNACQWFSDAGLPLASGTSVEMPRGTPVFTQGWKDGCNTSSYTRGNVFYKTIYSHRYNTKLIDNPEYRFGYSRGYSTCFQIMVTGNSGPQASFDRYLLPYGNNSVFEMSVGNINENWFGFFGSKSGILAGDFTNSDVTLDSVVNIWQNAERGGGTVFGSDPLWSGGSKGQIFGQ
jgi:hypothetical protein